ncbi:LysM peptidoglycan-binding domain-containing protein [Anaerobacillus sp. MEB173]|uniref:copper amine oxidase N-terminal domain-containing protein n=1 Tax=Anaerobacillus sp. MEB173 TaxID=3383345 RepID=UPI003F92AD2C
MSITLLQYSKLQQLENNEYALIINLDHYSAEFANELGRVPEKREDLIATVRKLLYTKYPSLRVTVIKLMVGGMVISAIPLAGGASAGAESIEKKYTIPTEVHEPIPFNPNSTSNDSVVSMQQAAGPKIILDGRQLNSEAVIINGSTFVPIRTVSESLGATVGWNNSTRTVTINNGDLTIDFVVGSTVANVNNQHVSTPPSFIRNGSTMVPLRFVSETLGLGVDWNNNTRTVTLNSKTANVHSSSTYKVAAGDTLWTISRQFNTTVDNIKRANNLTNDTIRVGQVLTITTTNQVEQQPASPVQTTTTYTVVAGDTLWLIANRHGVSVDAIKNANNLRTDIVQVNQKLTIPTNNGTTSTPTSTPAPSTNNGSVSISYKNHTIRSGDNMWNISQQYGIPYNELLKVNNMTERSILTIGQVIKVPVYNVPVKSVVSAKHGELLDWWTEARYVFSTGKVATITDFQTGKTFQVKHTMGGNHADSEPLTARDAQIMKEIWGGSYSWTPRAIIVEVDGRKLAAAMHSMPHGDQVIRDNNYNGHFCIHFRNSQRHSDGQIQDTMQRQIDIAAGLR